MEKISTPGVWKIWKREQGNTTVTIQMKSSVLIICRIEKYYCFSNVFFDQTLLAMFCVYAAAPVKISESPASNTAMVEHLKSFPHAVPSSICRYALAWPLTLQSPRSRPLRWVKRWSLETMYLVGWRELQGWVRARTRSVGLRCYQQNGVHWFSRA